MTKQLLATLAIGFVVIGAAVYSTVAVNQGHLLTLTGSITDVRVVELTLQSSLVILDFTAQNPSKVTFEMKELRMEKADGVVGDLLSKAELTRFLEYQKLAQPNPTLGLGDRIRGGETANRVVAARFDVPSAGLATAVYRIHFRHIENVDAQIEGRKP